jgi:hypothetical protein
VLARLIHQLTQLISVRIVKKPELYLLLPMSVHL